MAEDAQRGEQSGAEKIFGDFAPELVRVTDDVLFGRSGLAMSYRRRSGAS